MRTESSWLVKQSPRLIYLLKLLVAYRIGAGLINSQKDIFELIFEVIPYSIALFGLIKRRKEGAFLIMILSGVEIIGAIFLKFYLTIPVSSLIFYFGLIAYKEFGGKFSLSGIRNLRNIFSGKLFRIFRWFLFIPSAALLGVILTITISSIFEIFQGTSWTLYKEVFRSLAFGAGFVLTASYIAPDYKKRIALISSGMVIVFSLVGSYINLSLSTQPLVNLIVSGTSAILGSIIALLYVERRIKL